MTWTQVLKKLAVGASIPNNQSMTITEATKTGIGLTDEASISCLSSFSVPTSEALSAQMLNVKPQPGKLCVLSRTEIEPGAVCVVMFIMSNSSRLDFFVVEVVRES